MAKKEVREVEILAVLMDERLCLAARELIQLRSLSFKIGLNGVPLSARVMKCISGLRPYESLASRHNVKPSDLRRAVRVIRHLSLKRDSASKPLPS